MSELHDHLNQLAARGARRGADALLDAALAAADDDLEVLPVALSDDSARPARKGRSVFAAGGIAALLGVATLAISALVGGSGADSPEAAARQLADAIAREDPLAAVDVLAPDEVRTLRSTVDAVSARAAELELVDAAGAPLAGVDLSVEGLELTTEELAPGFAKVSVRGGTLTVRTDRSGLSAVLQRVAERSGDIDGDVDFATARPFDAAPFVVAVERDGSWYVSVAYTVLEYIRAADGGAPADYGSARASVASLGADSPEAAAEDMLRAAAAGDWLRVLELVPPDEVPVYDYRAMILAQGAESGSSPELTVTEFAAAAETDGGTAKVAVQALVTDRDGQAYRFADDCASSAYLWVDGEPPSELCYGVASFVPFYAAEPLTVRDAHDVVVTAVERDGRWFVSPVGTALDYLDTVVANVDRRWVYPMLGVADELEPDATLVLGQANAAHRGVRVYELAGRAGQRIIGTVEGECCSVSAQLYGPDGTLLDDAWGLFEGQEVTLAADGRYTLVVYGFGTDAYTIWDSAAAPPAAFESPWDDGFESGGTETCTTTVGGDVECSITTYGGVTPTTFGG